MREKSDQKKLMRLLKLASKYRTSSAHLRWESGKVTVETGYKNFSFPKSIFDFAVAGKLIANSSDRLQITGSGHSKLQQLLYPDEAAARKMDDLDTCTQNVEGKLATVVKNLGESPLMRLYTRRLASGNAYISEDQFLAGERLRSEFEKGNLQPNISASWQASVAGRKRGGASNQAEELGDFALDNRTRVQNALASIEPDLAGVAIDVCCFLKGLELVERERSWPPRSAKLMLRIALTGLARHYGIGTPHASNRAKMGHWGQEGYKPTLYG